jgi:hypothetical protein
MEKPKHETRQEVIKHSAAIHIHNHITLLQRRTWNALLYHAYNELESKEEHSIALPELASLVGYDSHDMDYLKEASKAMMRCLVEWDVLDKDGHPEWGATTLLAQATVKRNVLTYAYSPELRRRLHNPAMYARLDLNLQRQFDSKYGLALWELCTDYLGSGREYGETPFIAIDTYRKLIGIKEGGYPKFKEFNRCAIKEPVDEINRVSDFRVTVDYQREARKVTALKFKIRRVKLLTAAQHDQRTLFPDLDDMPPAVKELRDAGMSIQDALDLWQQGFGCVEENARPEPGEDVELAFIQYLREKIHLLKRRQASGKVENSTGFLREAIRKNYANPEFAEARQREEAHTLAQKRQAHARERKTLQERKDQLKRAHGDALHAHCQALIAASPALLDEAIAALQSDRMFRQSYWPDKTPAENYADRPILWITVDQYLERQYPDRFQALHAAQQAELGAFDAKIAALA